VKASAVVAAWRTTPNKRISNEQYYIKFIARLPGIISRVQQSIPLLAIMDNQNSK
jgi:hypothetical protein